MNSSASLSVCGRYRYALTRQWDAALPMLVWCMLNPSTATATEDDPTIRRVIGFAKRAGFGGIIVVNLFALRATDPAALLTADDPAGPGNDDVLRSLAERIPGLSIVCGWGASGGELTRKRAEHVADLLTDAGASLVCLGTNQDGSPKHPLYLPANATFRPWSLPA